MEEFFEMGALLLSQGTAGSFFSEGDKQLIESFVGRIDEYRSRHGYPTDTKAVFAEREYAFDELPVEAKSIITKWMTLSEKIFSSGGDGENTPFSGF